MFRFPPITSTMKQLRSVKSAPSSLRRAFLHTSAPKPNPSNLLNNASQYTGLSLRALRNECKAKGLKVSGRKAELVSRLTSFDVKNISNPRALNTTAQVLAKGDDSTIDFYKFPLEDLQQEAPPPPPFKIPVPADTPAPVRTVQSEYATPVPDDGAAASALSGTDQAAKVYVIGDTPVRTLTDDAVVNDDEEPFSNEELSSRDKSILTALAGIVGVWWFLGSLTEKKKKH